LKEEKTGNPDTIGKTFIPLLETKLHIPQLHASLVSRRRLLDQLNSGMQKRLILLSAPPGFGKTTLLADWVHQSELPTAWLSLDVGDNDSMLFLRYMIAALQRIMENVGAGVLQLMRTFAPPNVENLLINLLNDIQKHPEEFVLVLDDFHMVESPPIQKILSFLAVHIPPSMRLVISTRSDPPLALPRMRSRNRLSEIRAADLAFQADETRIFLNERQELNLSESEIERLILRTEGWPAGLHLAAASLQGREDVSGFIEAFSGDNRFVADYLVEEVLAEQPERIQKFLLWTSILNRLSGPLCDAVMQEEGGAGMLKRLEKSNLFVFSLDHEGRWFRYHRLFGDLLRRKLLRDDGAVVPLLSRRAGEWCCGNGFEEDALEYFLSAGDYSRASDLLESVCEKSWDRCLQSRMLQWLETLPRPMLSMRPQLGIYHVRALVMSGKMDEAESWLESMEKEISATAEEEIKVLPDGTCRDMKLYTQALRGRVAAIRTVLSTYRGDTPRIIRFGRKALRDLPMSDLLWRSVAASFLGMAHSWAGDGDYPAAQKAFEDAESINRMLGNAPYSLFVDLCLASVAAKRGALDEAKKKCESTLESARRYGIDDSGMASSIYALLGSVLCEQDDIDRGFALLEKGFEMAEAHNDVIALAANLINLTWGHVSKQNHEEAGKVLERIEELAGGFDLPPWIPHTVSGLKAAIWLKEGARDAVEEWAMKQGFGPEDEIPHRNEFEYMVWARLLLAKERFKDAEVLLTRMAGNAESGDRIGVLILIRMLKALALFRMDDVDEAWGEMAGALELGESRGFFTTFIDDAPGYVELLEEVMRRKVGSSPGETAGFSASYIKKILGRIKRRNLKPSGEDALDSLSERELEVLSLIAVGLTNQDIADQLFISLNTVRTHTKNIHGKLGVHSRTQAVARAKERKLL